jgi:hypothetical protein
MSALFGLAWSAVVGSFWGRIFGACLVGLVALKGYGWTQQKVGAEKATAKIEKATDNAAKAGKRAANRSADPSVRGKLDPTTRHD